MPPFPEPSFEYEYNVQAQINALREYEATKPGRDIPDKAPNRLLIATWNIANLGRPKQDRRAAVMLHRSITRVAQLVRCPAERLQAGSLLTRTSPTAA